MRWDILVLALAGVIYKPDSIPVSRLIGRFFPDGNKIEDIQVAIPGTTERHRVSSRGAAAVSMNPGTRAGCTTDKRDIRESKVKSGFFRSLTNMNWLYKV
jgi:hypothetical protein